MSDLNPRNMAQIRQQNPALHEALTDIVKAHNNVAQQTNASPVGQTPAPSGHTALTVTGGQGYFSAQITDNAPAYRGKENFLEVSEDPSFTAPHVIHLGPAQSWYGPLGEKTLHFRSYSQYPTSAPSEAVYQKNISGVGGTAPKVSGNGSGVGYGSQPYTGNAQPKR